MEPANSGLFNSTRNYVAVYTLSLVITNVFDLRNSKLCHEGTCVTVLPFIEPGWATG